MNNKQIGNKTEQLYLDMIHELRGFATLIPSTHLGQPIDTVAVVSGTVLFADIKHCSSDRFSFNSIEDNQILAMDRISKAKDFNAVRTNQTVRIGFMIYFSKLKKFKFLNYDVYRSYVANGEKSIAMLNNDLGGFSDEIKRF